MQKAIVFQLFLNFHLDQELDLRVDLVLEILKNDPIVESILVTEYALIVQQHRALHPKKNGVFRLKILPTVDVSEQYLRQFFFLNLSMKHHNIFCNSRLFYPKVCESYL